MNINSTQHCGNDEVSMLLESKMSEETDTLLSCVSRDNDLDVLLAMDSFLKSMSMKFTRPPNRSIPPFLSNLLSQLELTNNKNK